MRCLPSWAPSRCEVDAGVGEHQPVLFEAALAALCIRPDGVYVDGTFGRGGHSRGIVGRLGAAGKLLVMDRDPDAVRAARMMFAADPRVSVIQCPFSELQQQLMGRGWLGSVDGLLLDLGVSSPQLDDPARGFSFTQDGKLDMRMDPHAGSSAAEWLAQTKEQDMAEVFRVYGEERYAKRIARAVVEARRQDPIVTTGRLAAIVARAVPTREPGKHPATRTFQAIRIFLNRELDELASVLAQVPDALAPGGRLVVISFHSLEDRLVKRFIRDQSRGDTFPADLPVPRSQLHPRLRALGGTVHPSPPEVAANPRARSAVMRVAEKLP